MRELLHLWYTYGAEGSERVSRIAFAVFALLALIVGVLFFLGVLSAPDSLRAKLNEVIVSRFSAKDFAYVMTILTALMAAACTTFFGASSTYLRGPGASDSDAHWYSMAVIISLAALIAATLSFAAVYATDCEVRSSPMMAGQFHMLLMAFIQLVISFALFSATVMPIVSDRSGSGSGSIASAIHAFWLIPVGWLSSFLLATPSSPRPTIGTLFVLLSLVMAQVYYPHGWLRKRNEDAYRAALQGCMRCSFSAFTVCITGAGCFVIGDVLIWKLSESYQAWTTCGLFIVLGIGLWCSSVGTEGQRKFVRYERGPSGQLVRKEGG